MESCGMRSIAGSVMAVASVLLIWAGWQPIAVLDAIYLPDDTYYTLTIARNLAAGAGPSAGGDILTSGFQPLIAFLTIPVFWAGVGTEGAVGAVIVLSAVFGVLAAGMVALLICRLSGSRLAALLGGLFIATSPLMLSNSLNGLETSLAGFLSLLAVWCVQDPQRTDGRYQAIFTGIVIGLLLLARIDGAVLIVFIGLWLLWRAGPLRTALVAVTALITVAPWWIYCAVMFGSVVPESGEAVRQITEYHRETELSTGTAAIRALAAGGRFLFPLDLQVGNLPLALTAVVLYALVLRVARRRPPDIVSLLAAAAIALMLLYILYVPAYWFFERYFFPVFLAITVCGTTALAQSPNFPSRAKIAFFGVALLFLALNLIALQPYLKADIADTIRKRGGGKGYAQSAQAVLAHLPDRTVLGAMQSGALAYYAASEGRSIRVINLDGVVNGAAHEAIASESMADYALEIGLDYFADWQLNHDMFVRYLGQQSHLIRLEPLQDMAPQSENHRFRLYRVRADDR